jgi:DNA-directed RNA polymerase subunit RPC12/RpoP
VYADTDKIRGATMQKQFEQFRASELHCPKCRQLRPVKERLLLVIPGGEIHSYRCVVCGETLGTRESKSTPNNIVTARK